MQVTYAGRVRSRGLTDKKPILKLCHAHEFTRSSSGIAGGGALQEAGMAHTCPGRLGPPSRPAHLASLKAAIGRQALTGLAA